MTTEVLYIIQAEGLPLAAFNTQELALEHLSLLTRAEKSVVPQDRIAFDMKVLSGTPKTLKDYLSRHSIKCLGVVYNTP